jgi:hypothetical protein
MGLKIISFFFKIVFVINKNSCIFANAFNDVQPFEQQIIIEDI